MVPSHTTHYPVHSAKIFGWSTTSDKQKKIKEALQYVGVPTDVKLLAQRDTSSLSVHPVKAQRQKRCSFRPPTNVANKSQSQYCTVLVCTKHLLQLCPNCVDNLESSN